MAGQDKRELFGKRCRWPLGLRVVAWMVLPLILVVQDAQAGDPERAAQLFEQGLESFAREDFRKAAGVFMQAYELAPHGAPLYNAGLAWQAAGDAPRAADAYDQALHAEGLNPTQQQDTRRRLVELELNLGRLDVQGPPNSTVSVAHVEDSTLPARIHVKPGPHKLRVRFSDGRVETRTVTVSARAMALLFEGSAEPPPPTTPTPVRRETPPDTNWGSTFGWVSLGAAGVAAGGAVVFGVRALDAEDEFEASGYRSQDARDRALRSQNWTNASWIAFGVFGATGITLLLTSDGAGKAPDGGTEIGCRVGPGSASVVGQF